MVNKLFCNCFAVYTGKRNQTVKEEEATWSPGL
jgi:hypothetical protein